jgi:Tetratricopeptide repeat
MGTLFWKNGELGHALVYHRRALAFREATLGSQHEKTAQRHVGLVFHSMGDDTNAIVGHKKSFAIYTSLLGAEHPRVAGVYSDLGRALDANGDMDLALNFQRKTFKIKSTEPRTKSPTESGIMLQQHRSGPPTQRSLR